MGSKPGNANVSAACCDITSRPDGSKPAFGKRRGLRGRGQPFIIGINQPEFGGQRSAFGIVHTGRHGVFRHCNLTVQFVARPDCRVSVTRQGDEP